MSPLSVRLATLKAVATKDTLLLMMFLWLETSGKQGNICVRKNMSPTLCPRLPPPYY